MNTMEEEPMQVPLQKIRYVAPLTVKLWCAARDISIKPDDSFWVRLPLKFRAWNILTASEAIALYNGDPVVCSHTGEVVVATQNGSLRRPPLRDRTKYWQIMVIAGLMTVALGLGVIVIPLLLKALF